jgi:hypothetical protein
VPSRRHGGHPPGTGSVVGVGEFHSRPYQHKPGPPYIRGHRDIASEARSKLPWMPCLSMVHHIEHCTVILHPANVGHLNGHPASCVCVAHSHIHPRNTGCQPGSTGELAAISDALAVFGRGAAPPTFLPPPPRDGTQSC